MLASASGWAAETRKLPVLPLLPSELSAAMPTRVKGWKLKQATAKNTYTKWIQTRATRVFESEPRRKGEAPLTIRVKLTDTGGFYPSVQSLAALARQKGEGALLPQIVGEAVEVKLPSHLGAEQ